MFYSLLVYVHRVVCSNLMIVCISVESVVISPLSFFTASIWLFSLFFFINLASGLSILLIFLKKPAPGFIDFF